MALDISGIGNVGEFFSQHYLDALLERTIEHNPTRTVASLRRGILHNAVQQSDGTWVWRYQRNVAEHFGDVATQPGAPVAHAGLWDKLEAIACPVLLARGMLPQSVVGDDDIEELMRRRPHTEVVEFPDAGHSIQGDMPLELAEAIRRFAFA